MPKIQKWIFIYIIGERKTHPVLTIITVFSIHSTLVLKIFSYVLFQFILTTMQLGSSWHKYNYENTDP